MDRPLVFDLTNIVTGLTRDVVTGINRVDLTYARYFFGRRSAILGAHYGALRPHIYSLGRARQVVHRATYDIRDIYSHDELEWQSLSRWLRGQSKVSPHYRELVKRHFWPRLVTQSALRIVNDPPFSIPRNAVYLNVSQAGFEYRQLFRWLGRRADVTAVFLIHDLLPIDHSSLFPPGYFERFTQRVDTIVHYAGAIICATNAVRDRILEEYRRRRVKAPPILVRAFASPLGGSAYPTEVDDDVSPCPYFVILGTLEPRKGHAMLLDIWERIPVERRPKLVCVGSEGWGTRSLLNRFSEPSIQQHVLRLSGVSRGTLRRLIVNSRALLLPSLAEGYGLPIAEALTLGTPVIASDIAVFRETSQDKAEFLPTRDLQSWRRTIEDFSCTTSPRWQAAKERASDYEAPRRESYFRDVSHFIASL